jgi:ABC-2 type transport system permease protein
MNDEIRMTKPENNTSDAANDSSFVIRHSSFFRLLLWMHWRTFLARIRGVREQSRLLLFVLGAFVVGYLGVGYWLFHFGFNYIQQFPLVGALLSQRILFLIFGFFFVMLIFSNLIISYSTLFKNRETSWFLTLPIPHRTVYRWKFVEALFVSSWALMFLSAPMMAAFGVVHHVAPLFYVGTLLAYLPFVVLPALVGSWIILFLVRILSQPWVKKAVLLLAAIAILMLIWKVKPVTDEQAVSRHEEQMFDQLLRHTRLSLNPYLPSAWLAQSILAWSDGLVRQGSFFFLVSLSNALMGMLVGFELIGGSFYRSWTAALSSRAANFQRKAEAKRQVARRRSPAEWLADHAVFFSRPVRALALKDMRLFWRDPAQWTQFMIFFGLLCIYVLNLRNVSFNFQSVFWETMISYLNLAASALTLSTLTTRFVFPQFSLEGRRLWIIGLAPIGLRKVLMQKFWSSCILSVSLTASLMVASSMMLHQSLARVIFFTAAITIVGVTLSGLAVGLGALFPNLKEDNPSKIVSGFGGTLCLVISFIYITFFVALVALPGVRRVVHFQSAIPDGAAIFLALVLSACVLFFPLAAAMRRVKNLEF